MFFWLILSVRLFLILLCDIISSTFLSQKVVFIRRRKGGIFMTISDTVLNLVDKLIAEKEKNFMLQLQLQQLQQELQKTISSK